MPELPEVQTVRATLEPHLLGKRVIDVELLRPDVVRGDRSPRSLLAGSRVLRLDRLGKQLAIIADHRGSEGGVVCVHLGMTGSLCCRPGSRTGRAKPGKHAHIVWRLEGGTELLFEDPRRFGGLWTFDSPAALHEQRWRLLGPDALTITPEQLNSALARTRRSIKAALLDQSVLAGMGNIYVDEALFLAGIHPSRRADRLSLNDIRALTSHLRAVLHEAVAAGGSSLCDYVNANGQPGSFQTRHRVYGRAGLACLTCETALRRKQEGGRTTVFCPTCQPRRLRARVLS